MLKRAVSQTQGATIFGYPVNDPSRYGVVEFSPCGKAISLEEKPTNPKSRYAIPGLYFYDNDVVQIAKQLRPSPRGELEITDVNKTYLENNLLSVELFSRGFAWLDTGTNDSLIDACNFVATVEKRQSLKIACPEEIAYTQGFIDQEQLIRLADKLTNDYGKYLQALVKQDSISR
jgi:glucose-1-phosphate thymidylyltransferase